MTTQLASSFLNCRLEKLTKLPRLVLENNPNLTKAQIAELKKALPKCIISNSVKGRALTPASTLEQAWRLA